MQHRKRLNNKQHDANIKVNIAKLISEVIQSQYFLYSCDTQHKN